MLIVIVFSCSFSLCACVPRPGGNSVKATSGINGTPTQTQAEQKIPDNAHVFFQDTALSAAGGKKALVDGKLPDMPTTYPLVKVLTGQSGPAVEWLMDAFQLDLSLVSQLGGHSFPRTHRGKERFPGMTITYALMEKCKETIRKHGNHTSAFEFAGRALMPWLFFFIFFP
jgi:succinate dehydrogenase/fumarate reductase flavoprotein subunit